MLKVSPYEYGVKVKTIRYWKYFRFR